MLRYAYLVWAITAVLAAAPSIAEAQQTDAMSSADYIAKITPAAPPSVVKGATIVQMDKNGMRTLQTGSNGFTCMLMDPTTPMCADRNAMAWGQALMGHSAPPNSVGFVYMLAGDNGASNTDPYARAASADNHWIKTGPHVMMVGPPVEAMGYPMTADADPTKPYVMWAGTPYAHVMIPVAMQP